MQTVLDLIEAFRRSKTMFAAVELGIFHGKRPSDCKTLGRLLEACAALGLLEKRGEEFVNTGQADKYLRSDSPDTMAGYIRYSNRVLYRMWGHLKHAVREGTHRWKQTFDLDGPLFSRFSAPRPACVSSSCACTDTGRSARRPWCLHSTSAAFSTSSIWAGKLVGPKLLAMTTSEQAGAGFMPQGMRYGLGMMVNNGQEPKWFGHGGGAPGMNGELRIYPGTGVVAVLSNLDPPAATRLVDFFEQRMPLN